jgi:hypothetical protein
LSNIAAVGFDADQWRSVVMPRKADLIPQHNIDAFDQFC